MCRAFLTFTGHQKSIRVRETKILMVHQYFRPHQQRIQFYSERDWQFCSVWGFGVEPVPFSKSKASSRWRCQMLPLPSLPPSPSYNATPLATEGCRATRVSRDLFASPAHLVWQRALPVWQDRRSTQFRPLSGTLGQSFCPSALALLTDGTEHWESKKSVFTGNPSFPQGWLVCCWFIFYLKDNKTLSRKIDFIFRKDKGSSKSGITDSKTFRRIWKLISLQECYSFQLFIYSFWFFSLQDYCSFIFA